MHNEADPHSQIRNTSQPCEVHNQHKPNSHINHVHHIWPKGEGGPDIPENKVVICPTGHWNVHDLLQHYKMLMGNVPYEIIRRYTTEERKYAELGWKRMSRKEM